jgi:bla regulator protein BlaR1
MMQAQSISVLANHLWQSTLFAAAAGMLAYLLRRNHAQARYALWLIASLKFLIPFSLLIAIGSHLGWSTAPAATPSGFSVVVEQIGRPFLQ